MHLDTTALICVLSIYHLIKYINMIVCNKRLTRFEEYVKMLKISPMEVEDKSVEVKLITGILILKFLINSQL